MSGWLDKLLRQTVERTVAEHARPIVEAKVDEIIRTSPLLKFIKAGQLHLLDRLAGVDHKRAWDLFRDQALKEFMRDEKVKFGDPRYDWSPAGARDLAQAYILDHAEQSQ